MTKAGKESVLLMILREKFSLYEILPKPIAQDVMNEDTDGDYTRV